MYGQKDSSNMSSLVPTDAPAPRLCHMKKWPDFNGYGFNLHAEKGRVGQYIGKVDPGSPAVAAGLKENDRIVEVNGTNIANENHQQVVSRIKAVANEVKLLVVDRETDDYYKDKRVVVRGDMDSVVSYEAPATKAEFDLNPTVVAATTTAVATGGWGFCILPADGRFPQIPRIPAGFSACKGRCSSRDCHLSNL